MVRRILLVLDDEIFEKLKKLKGERSWEEFLVKTVLTCISSSSPEASEKSNVSSGKTETASKSSKETGDVEKSPNIFCKPKSRIYDVKLYVEGIEKRGVKVRDWWEEDDKYCFVIE
ncbi:MAG: hypothetical protein C0179_02855 [Fervidicoccus sp.]|nr:MAG: hypothetical protein C0179_02855 [Fervidicoccus sp.]